MSSGHYSCTVHCPDCGSDLPVNVMWWTSGYSYDEPPDGETNLEMRDGSPFPDKCPHCGTEFTDVEIDLIWKEAESKDPGEPDDEFNGNPFEDTEVEVEDDFGSIEPEAESRHMGPDQ